VCAVDGAKTEAAAATAEGAVCMLYAIH
jgi:hypothetical protein